MDNNNRKNARVHVPSQEAQTICAFCFLRVVINMYNNFHFVPSFCSFTGDFQPEDSLDGQVGKQTSF